MFANILQTIVSLFFFLFFCIYLFLLLFVLFLLLFCLMYFFFFWYFVCCVLFFFFFFVAVVVFVCVITKTCLYYFDPLKPQFYIVKLGFTGVYIIFIISAQNIDCAYSLDNLCF